MKNRIRIVRQPWTRDITDTLESRVYELYLNQVFPLVHVEYIGGDFSLPYEVDQGETRNVMLLGKLTDDPLNFLNLQPYISMVSGVKVSNEQSKIRGYFSAELLFKSETFRREFSSILVGTRDKVTQAFLKNLGIETSYITYSSILLGLIEDPGVSNQDSLDYLFIDLSEELMQVLQNKILSTDSFANISTKIPEILGELEKNSKSDSFLDLLRVAKIVVTSSPFFAYGAHSLGKGVVFVTNVTSNELLAISQEEFIEGLRMFDVSKFSYTLPQDTISKMQDSLSEFIEKSLFFSDNVRAPFEAQAYKNQVIAEIVNSISKSLSSLNIEINSLKSIIIDKNSELENLRQEHAILLASTMWKITAPLRKFVEFASKVRRPRHSSTVATD